MCHFVLVFFSPFGVAVASLVGVGAGLGAFRAFVRFVLVWICRFPLPLGVWEGLRLPLLEKRELVLVLFVHLFGLCLFGCRFPLPLGVGGVGGGWGLRFVIVALPGLFSCLF